MQPATNNKFLEACNFLASADICAKWDQTITAYDGTCYDKLVFDSPLHEQLIVTLNDSEKANCIWTNYKEIVLPSIKNSQEAVKIFEQWLLDHQFLLTCRKEDHLSELQLITKLSPFLKALSLFFSAISCTEHSHKTDDKGDRPRKIVIITTSAAGGELMVANAVEKYLNKLSFETSLVDVYKLFKNNEDFLYRFSGMHSVDIWGEIVQKENNSELADDFWWKCNQLRRFIRDNSSHRLKKTIGKLKPDLILTTRSFAQADAALAYDLNTPLRFIQCDYYFNPDLLPLAQRVNPLLVKFWIPSSEYIPTDPRLKDRVEVLGYPIRPAIQRELDSTKVEELRKKLKIQTNEKVLFIMMGRQGLGKTILPIIQKIISSSDNSLGPLHIGIVCGNNLVMKEEICNYLKTAQKPEQISFSVKGALNEEEIANYYNVAHVYLGKAGGSTTAELIQMKVFALICRSYELEKNNLNHLIAIKSGIELDFDSIVDQLKTFLQRDKDSIQVQTVNWQESIKSLMESAL